MARRTAPVVADRSPTRFRQTHLLSGGLPMNTPPSVAFIEENLDSLASAEGTVVVLADGGKALSPAGRHVDGLTGGALARALAAPGWKSRAKDVRTLNFPAGMAAERSEERRVGKKSVERALRGSLMINEQ